MRLLAIETSTEACSVALWLDGEVRERFEVAPRRHAELVLPWADALLAEAGIARASLDGIAVSRGPGAFTGVRLGISLTQGIALALDLPALAVSTLAVLAQGARIPEAGPADARVLAAIDARMGEVYLGGFAREHDAWRVLAPEAVMAPDAAALPGEAGEGGWLGVGTGFSALDGALRTRFGARLVAVDDAALPRAGDLARLAAAAFARGEAVAPELLEPAYLRNNVALTLAEQAASRQRG
ncbi:tRNA (adenosine(37)-N6)-threonylcarbamoyltransferase complex dimerization subunit type 1 TsaB [Luteimonas sp. MC1572]|uniref:tRNA (adenosine(37)-N6)-threonylcarbamoyltransferase complex dimerization subunit type 1 TsaB n=1 Tax=Luteimonas sp. MC1572 TaxID=2799325 RepID=UPI0018F083CA|nr:tRNA (adenosine(37)-N6)-threonylcarbamoyltransferase complex dimerization subunit type 1 TsaB [Luteimonas sp. MC1572]MBJ6981308.1 tRNA (adenosine(37)-N6)-threonylcarbamoyltransferase complex dimerization subunit type 1 TsaB [Luteimonas sp. MC1572]QQO02626.1 tRNA (adenosine(37)-N6)-threonylcarbamoyltransferase complex dimerization subunit type 1 TsaB [Luteimonas sp. MC1572]